MRRFELELDALKAKILEMGVVAERMVSRASEALVKRDRAIVADVLQGEETLDRFQVEIDGEAVRLITVYTPTAKDLRFLLRRCLQKDVTARLPEIRLARLALEEALHDPTSIPREVVEAPPAPRPASCRSRSSIPVRPSSPRPRATSSRRSRTPCAASGASPNTAPGSRRSIRRGTPSSSIAWRRPACRSASTGASSPRSIPG